MVTLDITSFFLVQAIQTVSEHLFSSVMSTTCFSSCCFLVCIPAINQLPSTVRQRCEKECCNNYFPHLSSCGFKPSGIQRNSIVFARPCVHRNVHSSEEVMRAFKKWIAVLCTTKDGAKRNKMKTILTFGTSNLWKWDWCDRCFHPACIISNQLALPYLQRRSNSHIVGYMQCNVLAKVAIHDCVLNNSNRRTRTIIKFLSTRWKIFCHARYSFMPRLQINIFRTEKNMRGINQPWSPCYALCRPQLLASESMSGRKYYKHSQFLFPPWSIHYAMWEKPCCYSYQHFRFNKFWLNYPIITVDKQESRLQCKVKRVHIWTSSHAYTATGSL